MEDFWYGMEMEWKKIASMEYGKIVFHSIPYHALKLTTQVNYFGKNILWKIRCKRATQLLLGSFYMYNHKYQKR